MHIQVLSLAFLYIVKSLGQSIPGNPPPSIHYKCDTNANLKTYENCAYGDAGWCTNQECGRQCNNYLAKGWSAGATVTVFAIECKRRYPLLTFGATVG
ncbi:hypothetical protein WAI453_000827 [Rhynchosporium graminicola]